MFFQTRLKDETYILLEAETSGAFAKNDLEGVGMTPDKALENIILFATQVTEAMSAKLAPAVREAGATAEVSFSLRSDSQGNIMIGTQPGTGQFHVTLKYGG